jgi:hypothetical protein
LLASAVAVGSSARCPLRRPSSSQLTNVGFSNIRGLGRAAGSITRAAIDVEVACRCRIRRQYCISTARHTHGYSGAATQAAGGDVTEKTSNPRYILHDVKNGSSPVTAIDEDDRKPRRAAIAAPLGSGDKGDRTPDLVNAIHALSQLSYIPETGRFVLAWARAVKLAVARRVVG